MVVCFMFKCYIYFRIYNFILFFKNTTCLSLDLLLLLAAYFKRMTGSFSEWISHVVSESLLFFWGISSHFLWKKYKICVHLPTDITRSHCVLSWGPMDHWLFPQQYWHHQENECFFGQVYSCFVNAARKCCYGAVTRFELQLCPQWMLLGF